MPDTDRRLELVRKLLAKAEDPACTPAEAETLTTKAAELIARYGIDRAALAAAEPSSDQLDRRKILCEAPYARDKSILLSSICGPLRVRTVRQTRRNDNGDVTMHLFGYTSDLDRVDILYTSLLIQASYGLASSRPDQDHPWRPASPAQIAAYRRSWLDGFSAAIFERLTRAETRARHEHEQRTGNGMELVLVDRASRVDRMVAEAFPQLRQQTRRTLSGRGREPGYHAGQRADLGTTGLGQTPNQPHQPRRLTR